MAAPISLPSIRLSSNWLPSDLANLSWWSKADGNVYTTYNGSTQCVNDDRVGYLEDLSGNAMHGIQGTGSSGAASALDQNKPVFKSDVFRNRPGIFFDNSAAAATSNQFLNLQKAMYNGVTEFTIAIVLSFAAASGSSRLALGAGSTNLSGLRLLNAGAANYLAPTGSTQLTDAITGVVSWGSLPNPLALVCVVRGKAGTGLQMYVNGVLTASESWASGAISHNHVWLLGNSNATNSSTAITPATNTTRYHGYFHEGLCCAGRYVTDAELGHLHRYLFRRWPFMLPSLVSPNIVPPTGHVQGVASDRLGNYYVSHTSRLEKYNSAWTLQATNTDPFAGLAAGLDHVGDIGWFDGELFATPSIGGVGSGKEPTIAVYDDTTLALVRSRNVSDDIAGIHLPGIAVAPEINRLFSTDYYGDASDLFEWRLDDLSFVGTITLSTPLANAQGMTYKHPYIYFSLGSDSGIYRCYPDGSGVEQVSLGYSTVQGLGFDPTNNDLLLCRNSSANDRVWRYKPL